jgi:hypothetical protein
MYELFIETHKYKARINSNDKLACYREIYKFIYTYRPSFSKRNYVLQQIFIFFKNLYKKNTQKE